MKDLPILSISILLPIISALYIAFFISNVKSSSQRLHAMYVGILASGLTVLSTLYIVLTFNPTAGETNQFQFIERYKWIDSMGLEFYVGVDGLSVYFIFLSALLTLVCIIASFSSIKKNVKEYVICLLLLESFCIGAFSSLNLLLFYVFFEVILIPMYIIIGVWGGENRVYASVKFFLYTFLGSVFLLLALIYLYINYGTFEIAELAGRMNPYLDGEEASLYPELTFNIGKYVWLAMFLAFAVKVPMVPFHTWLPDAHVQAPTAGSVMLAGILLKLGGYAFLRVLIPLLPNESTYFAPYVIYLSGFAIIYASLVALAQKDMKKMIAYSSVAHMGYVTAGIFSFSPRGMTGAVFQMISHGVISAALFLVVGMLYERHHTKEISKYGGVAVSMPILSTIFMIAMLGSIGLPGSSGFVGEFLCILGVFDGNVVYKTSNPLVGIICAFGVILGAVYMLKLYKSVIFGEVTDQSILKFKDLILSEKLAFVPLIALIIYLGIKPECMLTVITEGVYSILKM